MKYFDELKKAMQYLAKNEKTIFIGQAVEVPGTAMSNTLKDINMDKRIELPVAEEMQMGITIGLALNGIIPVSIYPRWNFILLAMNQLINHLDKINLMSNGGFNVKTIIRTAVGSERPLHPHHQHVGDFTDAFRVMLKNIDIVRLQEPSEIFTAYRNAYEREDGRSTIIVEYGDYLNEK